MAFIVGTERRKLFSSILDVLFAVSRSVVCESRTQKEVWAKNSNSGNKVVVSGSQRHRLDH